MIKYISAAGRTLGKLALAAVLAFGTGCQPNAVKEIDVDEPKPLRYGTISHEYRPADCHGTMMYSFEIMKDGRRDSYVLYGDDLTIRAANDLLNYGTSVKLNGNYVNPSADQTFTLSLIQEDLLTIDGSSAFHAIEQRKRELLEKGREKMSGVVVDVKENDYHGIRLSVETKQGRKTLEYCIGFGNNNDGSEQNRFRKNRGIILDGIKPGEKVSWTLGWNEYPEDVSYETQPESINGKSIDSIAGEMTKPGKGYSCDCGNK